MILAVIMLGMVLLTIGEEIQMARDRRRRQRVIEIYDAELSLLGYPLQRVDYELEGLRMMPARAIFGDRLGYRMIIVPIDRRVRVEGARLEALRMGFAAERAIAA